MKGSILDSLNTKPLLFLDVDGVLSLLPKDEKDRPDRDNFFLDVDKGILHEEKDLEEGHGLWAKVRLTKKGALLIELLMSRFTVLWATDWREAANTYLSPYYNIPEFELIPRQTDSNLQTSIGEEVHNKLPVILDRANESGLPFVWVDNEISDKDINYAAKSTELDHKLYFVDGDKGLTFEDVYDLCSLADSWSAGVFAG